MPVDFHNLRNQGHGGRSAHPVKLVVSIALVLVVHGLAGFHIGADHDELHGVGLVGGKIERVVYHGHFVVAEAGAVQVALAEQVAPAAVAFIGAESLVIADGAPDLPRFVIAAESCPCRYADRAIEFNAGFHYHIHDSGCEHTAHGAAFQNKPLFHDAALCMVSSVS